MFRRCVFLAEVGLELDAAVSLARILVPEPEVVHALGHVPAESAKWLVLNWGGAAPNLGTEADLAALRAALEGWGARTEVEAVGHLEVESIAAALTASGADAVVVGPFGARAKELPGLMAAVAGRCGVPVVYLGPRAQRPRRPRPHALYPFREAREVAGLAGLGEGLRRLGALTLLALDTAEPRAGDPEGLAEVVGVSAPITLAAAEVGLLDLDEVLGRAVQDAGADVLVWPVDAVRGLASLLLPFVASRWLESAPVPLIFVPPALTTSAWPAVTTLDVSDALVLGQQVRLTAEVRDLLDRDLGPPEEGLFGVLAGEVLSLDDRGGGVFSLDQRAARLTSRPGGRSAAILGLWRRGHDGPELPFGESRAQVIEPGVARVLLFDEGQEPEALRGIRALLEAPSGEPWLGLAVRLEPSRSLRAVRRRLAEAGFEQPWVLEASALLDDGRPEDLPGDLERLRLRRVALRLRAEGIAVAAIVTRGAGLLGPAPFPILTPAELSAEAPEALKAACERTFTPPHLWSAPREALLSARLDELTGSSRTVASTVAFELDNRAARLELFALLEAAEARVHVQSYIVRDDPVMRELEARLLAAARRGVRVRLLADALYSLHESYGAANPLLARLAAEPGIEVRTHRPLAGVPSLEDLRQRNHRKLVVVDGRTAVVGGRNLAAEYWLGFDEVALGPESSWREVPWLDAGVRLEGEVVEVLDAAFRSDWIAAGGDPWPLIPARSGGALVVRPILQEGRRDTAALEALLTFVEAAESRLTVVNAFPMQLEIQRALLAAIGRGVRLTVLFGPVRPQRGDGVPFAGGAPRDWVGQLVLARLDPLVEAGAEVLELTVPHQTEWAPELAGARAYVHAKLLLADGRRCLIGSANLDITASYWESEILLWIDAPGFVAQAEAELAPWLAAARRLDPADDGWRRQAERRVWLSRGWPNLLT